MMTEGLPPGPSTAATTTRARKYKSITSLKPELNTWAANAPAELPGSEPGSPAHNTTSFRTTTPRTHLPSPLQTASADPLSPQTPSPMNGSQPAVTSPSASNATTTKPFRVVVPAPTGSANTHNATGVHARRTSESNTVTQTIAGMFAPPETHAVNAPVPPPPAPYTACHPMSAIPAKLKWGVANSPALSTGNSPAASPRTLTPARPSSAIPTNNTQAEDYTPACPPSPTLTRMQTATGGPGILDGGSGVTINMNGAASPTMNRTGSLNRVRSARHSTSGVLSLGSGSYVPQGSMPRGGSTSGTGNAPFTATPAWFRHSNSDVPAEVLTTLSMNPAGAAAAGQMSPINSEQGSLLTRTAHTSVKTIAQSVAMSISRSVTSTRAGAPLRPSSAAPGGQGSAAAANVRAMGRLQSLKAVNPAVLPGSPSPGSVNGAWFDDALSSDVPLSPGGVRAVVEISPPDYHRMSSGRGGVMMSARASSSGTTQQIGTTTEGSYGGAVAGYQRQPSMSMSGLGGPGAAMPMPSQTAAGGYGNRFCSQPQVSIPIAGPGFNSTSGMLVTRNLVVVPTSNHTPMEATFNQQPAIGGRSATTPRPQLTVVTSDLGQASPPSVQVPRQAISNHASAAAAACALLQSKALLLSSPQGAVVSSPQLNSPALASGAATPKDRSHAALLDSGMAILQALQPSPAQSYGPQQDTPSLSPGGHQSQGQGGDVSPKEVVMMSPKEAGVVRSQFATLSGVLSTNTWERQLVNGFNASTAPTPDAAYFKRKAAIRNAQEARDNALR